MADIPDLSDRAPIARYSNSAVAFHWLTVVLVLGQAVLGFVFADMTNGPEKMSLFAWHKTIGPLILVITLIRLGYRLTNPPPAYPADLPRWERIAATWNHWAFYVLLIVMPLTGLIAVSAHTRGAFTRLVLGIPFPVIPGVGKGFGAAAGDIHGALALVLVALILLHAGAALKHQFIDKWAGSARMPPFQPADHRPVVVGQGEP